MMFRLRSVNSCLRRLLHGGAVNRDQVLEQLRVCSGEEQVFDVVGKNKAKLTVNHVGCAVEMLWRFQKDKHPLLRTVELVRSHPQFLTLRVLAENKIAHMDDVVLVDTLYNFLRLNVDDHDSLVQHLVSEAWSRLDNFQMASLSKFAICLHDQQLNNSPLMGHITSIVDQKLSTIDDARILSALMLSISPLVSPRLRDALISRATYLLDTMDPSHYNNPRRVLQFLRNIKYSHRPLLDKCNQILLRNIPMMDADNIGIITALYHHLQFDNFDFRLAAKQRLIELIDSSTDPFSFTKMFVVLAPLASPETRERLENKALLLVDELSPLQVLAVAETLEEIQCRNLGLLTNLSNKKNNPELFTKLRNILLNFLQHSFFPFEVTMLIRVLSMLPCPQLDDVIISRIDAVVTQCNLSDLSALSYAIAKWVRNDPSYHHNTHSKYVRLLQTLNRCSLERLQTAQRLDLVLEELKYISGDWFEQMMLEEAMAMLQRLMEQINSANVSELALILTRTNHLCPPLMDHIASIVIRDIDKIFYSGVYAILLPFSVMNYDPPQADEFYDVCFQHVTPHISSFEPHLLVLLAYCLALADYFPEVLVKEIFSINFLGRLDSQLETVSDALNMRIRLRLMEFNRAVCLECPEFQVPWFHERYCQQLQKKWNGMTSPVQQNMHKMLAEVLGGNNFIRVSVTTPYFYHIDFECKLDKHLQPLPYKEPSTLQISDKGKVHWGVSSLENMSDELPPGAQRVAVDFLDSKCFCKHSHHMKGDALMRIRHLEILGYRVVQIPHFEWNSMELSTQDAWKEYLKKKLFRELSS
uniref:RAP domain-containing protein n=1 Tax=Anabas testudineus TaxID=64144 RepID=A0A3Q1J3K8_ANATE